jgi:hypothetical protein
MDSLPPEILTKILTLSRAPHVNQVCRLWNALCVDAATRGAVVVELPPFRAYEYGRHYQYLVDRMPAMTEFPGGRRYKIVQAIREWTNSQRLSVPFIALRLEAARRNKQLMAAAAISRKKCRRAKNTFELLVACEPSDLARLESAYASNDTTTIVALTRNVFSINENLTTRSGYNSPPAYVGRCCQFLIDTYPTMYDKTRIEKMTCSDVIAKAHSAHDLIRAHAHTWNISLCDCESWTYGNNRCDCGDRKIFYDDSDWRGFAPADASKFILDENNPHGHADYY